LYPEGPDSIPKGQKEMFSAAVKQEYFRIHQSILLCGIASVGSFPKPYFDHILQINKDDEYHRPNDSQVYRYFQPFNYFSKKISNNIHSLNCEQSAFVYFDHVAPMSRNLKVNDLSANEDYFKNSEALEYLNFGVIQREY
jgi:hypothetical protein